MMTARRTRTAASIAVAALILAACQAEPAEDPEVTPHPTEAAVSPTPPEPTPAATPEPTETPEEVAVDGPRLVVADATGIGEYVVDEEGFTLYIFLNDMPRMSHCVEQCAATWPPLTVDEGDEPVADDEITGELGTITRADGTLQVTLDDWPLYYYAPDTEPGDTDGEGVGNVWFVARPDGSIPNGSPGGVDGY